MQDFISLHINIMYRHKCRRNIYDEQICKTFVQPGHYGDGVDGMGIGCGHIAIVHQQRRCRIRGIVQQRGGYAIYWQMDCRQPDGCQEHGAGMRRLFPGE